jgi:hypothetical protein
LAYVAAEEQARRPVPAEHSTHGTTLHIGPDIRDWPDHWRRINGLRPEDLRPRGRTHTVAQVLDSPSTQELRCTIAACVIDLADGSGWTRVRVDDGTGVMSIS